ncbi:YraN family protein [Oceanicaulis sp. LC35]|uniref:YraN family protein n=1 Tax=Oceanicaulis sp. LC35 TaxID=3349635 RepID=UPI003F864128
MTQARRQAERLGRRTETLSALWLRLKGWRILDERARTGAGELDLVARRGGVLAFIEVKRRKTNEAARYAITPRQQHRLVRAASLWRSRHGALAHLQPRFDVIVWSERGWPRHIEGAFSLESPDLDGLI